MRPGYDELLTLESVSPCLVEEVLLIAVVWDVADALPEDFAQGIDLESSMLSSQVLIVASFMRRIVDIPHSLVPFGEYWGVLWYLLAFWQRYQWTCAGQRSWHRR
jgi:hypothetical protein